MTLIQVFFSFLFVITSICFFISLLKNNFIRAYIYILLCIPMVIKLPFLITIVDHNLFKFRVAEGVNIIGVYQILFILSLIKNKLFLSFLRYLKIKKVIAAFIICAISISLYQYTFGNFGIKAILLGLTEIIDPLNFILITSYVFLLTKIDLFRILTILNYSVLFFLIFTILNGLFLKEVAGDLRISGGVFGNATLAGSIFATMLFYNSSPVFSKFKKNQKENIFFSIFFLILLIFTKTRGALLGLVIAYLITFWHSERKIKLKIILFIVPILLLILPFILDVYSSRTNSLSDNSIVERFIRNFTALESIQQNPFGALGWANPPYIDSSPYEIIGLKDPNYEIHFHIYNTFIAWASYGGIISCISFIFILFIALRSPINKCPQAKILNGAIIIWIIDFMTTGNMLLFSGYPYSGVIFFFLTLAIKYAYNYEKQKYNFNSK